MMVNVLSNAVGSKDAIDRATLQNTVKYFPPSAIEQRAVERVNRLIVQTVAMLQNMYVCAMGADMEGEASAVLLETQKKTYKTKLMDLLTFGSKRRQKIGGKD